MNQNLATVRSLDGAMDLVYYYDAGNLAVMSGVEGQEFSSRTVLLNNQAILGHNRVLPNNPTVGNHLAAVIREPGV
jgi:hypothetical protein